MMQLSEKQEFPDDLIVIRLSGIGITENGTYLNRIWYKNEFRVFLKKPLTNRTEYGKI